MKEINKTEYPRQMYRQFAAQSYRNSRSTTGGMREWYKGQAAAFKHIDENTNLTISTFVETCL